MGGPKGDFQEPELDNLEFKFEGDIGGTREMIHHLAIIDPILLTDRRR